MFMGFISKYGILMFEVVNEFCMYGKLKWEVIVEVVEVWFCLILMIIVVMVLGVIFFIIVVGVGVVL